MTSRSVGLFVVALGLGALFLPCVGEAQPAKVYRVGVLSQGSAPPSGGQNFTKALHDLGYIEGSALYLVGRTDAHYGLSLLGVGDLGGGLSGDLFLKPKVWTALGFAVLWGLGLNLKQFVRR